MCETLANKFSDTCKCLVGTGDEDKFTKKTYLLAEQVRV